MKEANRQIDLTGNKVVSVHEHVEISPNSCGYTNMPGSLNFRHFHR